MVVLSRRMRTALFVVASLAATAGVIAERTAAARLREQLAAQRDYRREVDALRSEQERLRALRAAAEQARLQAEAARTKPEGLTAGKWLPPSAWKNRGCATPANTMESMLWAAAGGEAATLGNMLLFSDETRAKLDEIFRRLPPEYRIRYVSPAQLVAAFTTEAIPLGNAQLVSEIQTGPDEAETSLWITLPDYRPINSSPSPSQMIVDELIGPTWRHGQRNRASFLLRRIDGVWRLVVPMSAVEKIEREVGGLK